jgi:hypothetical protein
MPKNYNEENPMGLSRKKMMELGKAKMLGKRQQGCCA